MNFSVREMNKIQVLDIQGNIDLYNVKQLKDMVDSMIAENKSKIVLNLDNVPFIDSSGLGAIFYIINKIKKSGGIMKVSKSTNTLTNSIEMILKDTNIQFCHSIEEAVQLF